MRKKTVLVVTAHADDMEFMAAGTVARFVDERGYDVHEYILTDNSKGSFRLSGPSLVEISAREARAAGEILGLASVRLEGYVDGELNTVHPNVLREKVMACIRELKADIIMSWDPFAAYEDHPDHRAAAIAALDAATFSGNPLFHPEQAQGPHLVTEAYWFAKNPGNDATCFVDIGSSIEKKIQALLAHECQMELTVDALIKEAEAVGAQLPLLANLTVDTRNQVIEAGIQNFCAETGQQGGLNCAERFRYEKFGLLEKLFGVELIEPDFA